MVILFLLVLPLGLLAPTPQTLGADAVLAIAIVVASALNRIRQTTFAGLVVTVVLGLAIASVITAQPLDWVYVPGFDLLVIVPMVAALVLPKRIMWFLSVAVIAFIVADVILQPRAADLNTFLTQYGIVSLIGRPIALVFIITISAHILVAAYEGQIVRSDRAEEIAELERREIERNRELEEGVRQLLDIHVHIANGDFNIRAQNIRNPLLWQIGSSLNNLINRIARLAQADFTLRRVQDETPRVVESIRSAQNGRPPIWPGTTYTPLDQIVDVLRTGPAFQTNRSAGQAQPSQPYQAGQQTPQGAGWPQGMPQPQQPQQPNEAGLPDWLIPGGAPGPLPVPDGPLPRRPDPYSRQQAPQPPQTPFSNPPRQPDNAGGNPWSLDPEANLPDWLRNQDDTGRE